MELEEAYCRQEFNMDSMELDLRCRRATDMPGNNKVILLFPIDSLSKAALAVRSSRMAEGNKHEEVTRSRIEAVEEEGQRGGDCSGQHR